MSQATRILLALVAGLLLGIVSARYGGVWVQQAIAIAEPVGGLWLDALRMTIVPLVVALVITGIAESAEAAQASQLAGRSILLFVLILWSTTIMAAFLVPLLLQLWPMPDEAAAALRGALSASTEPVGEVPGFGAFLRSIVPANPIAAAADDAILPLILFTTLFAFALTQIGATPRKQMIGFFRGIAEIMLVMIGWILWLAPIGVTALAFVVGARTGTAAVGALFHYVAIVSVIGIFIWLLAYPLAMFGGRLRFADFARAIIPSQAVAISTQSSLASLPAMLRSAKALNVPVAASGVTLPLAVALFRATSPAMNLAVILYVAHWFGMPLGPGQLAVGVAVAAITTMGSVSLPSQISFVTTIAPIGLAMGIPIEPLLLLIAVETIPDIFRTLGNVTMDVAVTATAARQSGFEPGDDMREEDELLEAS